MEPATKVPAAALGFHVAVPSDVGLPSLHSEDMFAPPPQPSESPVEPPATALPPLQSLPTLAPPNEELMGGLPAPKRPSYLVEPTPKPPPYRPAQVTATPEPQARSARPYFGVPTGLLLLASLAAAAATGLGLFFLLPGPAPPPPPPEPVESEYVAVPLGTLPHEEPVEEPPAEAPKPKKPVARGVIRVRSTPVAAVRLDGKYVGDTQAFEQSVPVGWHTVTIKAPGKTEAELRVNVGADAPLELCWDFEKGRYCEP
jgi:hypothetical protein